MSLTFTRSRTSALSSCLGCAAGVTPFCGSIPRTLHEWLTAFCKLNHAYSSLGLLTQRSLSCTWNKFGKIRRHFLTLQNRNLIYSGFFFQVGDICFIPIAVIISISMTIMNKIHRLQSDFHKRGVLIRVKRAWAETRISYDTMTSHVLHLRRNNAGCQQENDLNLENRGLWGLAVGENLE